MTIARLFEHHDYLGYEVKLETEGEYDLDALMAMGMKNDDISSIRVAPGYTVTLYEHHHFGGSELVLTADTPEFVPLGWNDKTSSIKVSRPVAEAPSGGGRAIFQQVSTGCVSLLMLVGGGWYSGSGFVIEHQGAKYVCTAAHNVVNANRDDPATEVWASLAPEASSGAPRLVRCTVVGVAGYADVGVLKMDEDVAGLTPLALSAVQALAGDWCCLVGDPLGADALSFSDGVVRDGTATLYNIVESTLMSCPVHPGHSGSPILNSSGQVIGITSYGMTGTETLGWGASASVIGHVVPIIIGGFLAGGAQSNFIGGGLGSSAFLAPVDAWRLRATGNAPGILAGYYVDGAPGLAGLNADDVITKIGADTLGVYPDQGAPTALYLSPGETLDCLITRSGSSSSVSLVPLPLALAEDQPPGGYRGARPLGPVRRGSARSD